VKTSLRLPIKLSKETKAISALSKTKVLKTFLSNAEIPFINNLIAHYVSVLTQPSPMYNGTNLAVNFFSF